MTNAIFYTVANFQTQNGMSSTKYTTYEAALAEATRLAQLNVEQEFTIMQAKVLVRVDDITVIAYE